MSNDDYNVTQLPEVVPQAKRAGELEVGTDTTLLQGAKEHAGQQYLPDTPPKPLDIEDHEERPPIDVVEAAKALPHWRDQVSRDMSHTNQPWQAERTACPCCNVVCTLLAMCASCAQPSLHCKAGSTRASYEHMRMPCVRCR